MAQLQHSEINQALTNSFTQNLKSLINLLQSGIENRNDLTFDQYVFWCNKGKELTELLQSISMFEVGKTLEVTNDKLEEFDQLRRKRTSALAILNREFLIQ